MFERVEIVKDGAGSIYGSDALSGIFKVMMVSHFDGARVDSYYGNTTKNDAGVQRYGLIAGRTLGKTNVVVASYEFKGDQGATWVKWLKGTTSRISGNNVTDVEAPFAAGAFNDGYDVATHSNRGRFLYTQLTRKF